MSAPTLATTTSSWPAELLEFAERQKVRSYLDPLREALDRTFPTARSVKVYVADDPEFPDDRHVVFEVLVSVTDVPDHLAAGRRWHEALFRICPAPLAPVFRLLLLREDV